MKNKMLATLLIMIFIVSIITYAIPVANAYKIEHDPPSPDIRKISPALRAILYEGKAIKGLAVQGDAVRGKITVNKDSLNIVLQYVKPYLVFPFKDSYILFGYYRLSDVEKISSISGVENIQVDVLPTFGLPEKANINILSTDIEPTLYTMRNVVRADLVEDIYGYTGDGVVIAVIDTGIDYAQPNLRNKLIYEEDGTPLVLDSDALGLIYPFYEFTVDNGYLRTANKTVLIYTGVVWWQDILYGTQYYSFINYTIPADFYIGNITSASGTYKLGFQYNWMFMIRGGYHIIPVLLVDSEEPGVYDTVYIDITTVYNVTYLDGAPDYSFVEETPYHLGDIIAEDFTGDGIPDISLGVVGGYFLDNLLMFGGGFRKGFPESGEYLTLFYDFHGHGTACAGAATSDGSFGFDIYGENITLNLIGIARDANILGIQALFNGFVEAGWFFAAGFDTEIMDGLPVLVYSGRTRADMTSNSWGISLYIYDYFVFGADFVSMLEDAFSIPGFLHPAYPGMIMVQAGGNGGPGYGTITSPGASTLAITVGASTSFHWVKIQTPLPFFFDNESGYSDNIIFWSLRGPTPLGTVKPDVVNIGAFGWVPGMIAAGNGDGSKSYSFFGGTSQATPLTAGVIALLLEALRDNNITYTPQYIKSIIMNTAVDLNYPEFIQGAGRVDAYNAVSSVVNGSIYAYSYDTWLTLSATDFLSGSWLFYLGSYPPALPLASGSIFAGYLVPDMTATSTITIENIYNDEVTINITDYYLKKLETEYYTFTSMLNDTQGVVFIKIFEPLEFIGVDLVIFNLYFNYSLFDIHNKYWYTTYQALVFGEWDDMDGDGVIDDGEFFRMNYAYSRANVQELTLNNPYKMMRDPINNKLVLYIYRVTEEIYDIPTIIKMTKYVKTDNPYIASSTIITLPPNSISSYEFTINVPINTKPGIYSGFIEITSDRGEHIIIPISWSVAYVVDSPEFSIGGIEPSDETPYDQYSTMGRQQWGWRYESGDWRIFHIYVPKAADYIVLNLMEILLEWQNPDSGFDFYLHDQYGFLIGTSEYGFYLGKGRFLWHTTLNQTALIGYAYPPLGFLLTPDYGLYILSVRNYQYGGLVPAESFKISFKLNRGILAFTYKMINVVKYEIEASKDNPLYSYKYFMGYPSILTYVYATVGEISLYSLPVELPNYLYANLSVLIIILKSSPEASGYAEHITFCFRPITITIRIYNAYMPILAYRLDTYRTLIIA